jgi:1-acyl-sn-glycerol-3-phosphate acyltransferase
MGRRYKADHRGRLFNAVWPFTRWFFSLVTATVGAILFFGLSRTEIIGRRNALRTRNVLLLSNHQSLIDSFLIGFSAYYGPAIYRPWLAPWNPAAEENFYKNAYQGWWSDQWKCIPVAPGRRDMRALYRMIRALRDGTMILFPEGTRTRNGEVGEGRPGAGLVALANRPHLIPVTVEGMNDVLPIGAAWPRPFQRVTILFGPAIDYSHLAGEERSKKSAQSIVDLVMSLIRYQHDWIRRYRKGLVGRDTPPWVEPGYQRILSESREAARLAQERPEVESLPAPDGVSSSGSRAAPESAGTGTRENSEERSANETRMGNAVDRRDDGVQ